MHAHVSAWPLDLELLLNHSFCCAPGHISETPGGIDIQKATPWEGSRPELDREVLRGLRAGPSWAGAGVSPGTRAGKELSRKKDSHRERGEGVQQGLWVAVHGQEACNTEGKSWVFMEDGGSLRKRNERRERREKIQLEELDFQKAEVI